MVFDALSHPTRRALLDLLRDRDGRSLVDLERDLNAPVTRFAVMKHLRILKDAQLVVTRPNGRETLHFLNAAPLQLVADRWISRFAAPLVRAMADLKYQSEGQFPMPTSQPCHVYELFVRAEPSKIWDVLTDDSKTPLYQHFNMRSRTDWRVGGAIEFLMDDKAVIVGEILCLDEPHLLTMTFHAQWSPEVAADKPSRVTWEIREAGPGVSKLVLTHDDFGGVTATSMQVVAGWPETISRLKTLVETGESFSVDATYAPA